MRARVLMVAVTCLTVPVLATAQSTTPLPTLANPTSPTPPAAPSAPAKPAGSEIKLTPYGILHMAGFVADSLYGTRDPDPSKAPSSQMDYPGFVAGGRGGVFATARQSRFGIRLDFPDALGATIKGVFEGDFKGGYAGTSNMQAYTPVPRLRIAWGAATWKTSFGSVGVGAGQEFGLVNPVAAVSSAWAADPLFYLAGNVWRRSAQFRLFGDFAFASGVGVTWAAAVLDPVDNVTASQDYGPGNASKTPDVEGRLAVNYKADKKTIFELGAGYHYGDERYRNTETRGNEFAPKRLVGVDAQLHVSILSLRGEWFQGENIDTYWGNSSSGVTGAPNAPKSKRSMGFWGQAVVTPIPALQLHGGFGTEDPDDKDLPVQDAGRSVRSKNQMIVAGIIVNPTKYWRLGCEVVQTTTTYLDAGERKGKFLALSSAFTF